MTVNTLGDLARNFQMRAQQVRMKTEIDRLSQEVTTGLAADVATRVRGDFAPISGVERDLSRVAAYRSAATEAAGFADAAQQALGRVEGLVADLGPDLLAAASTNPAGLALIVGEDAEAAFATAVSALNTSFAGRYLFSGAATTSPPLNSADDMLTALRADVAGETTAAGVVAVGDAGFGPGGAFEASHYLGSDTPLAPMRVWTFSIFLQRTKVLGTGSNTTFAEATARLSSGAGMGRCAGPSRPARQRYLCSLYRAEP